MKFMTPYFLDDSNRFIISNFQQQPPFSSTLPGTAGQMVIPVCAFFVNRGQGITSFGVENKDHPIMEFQPANKAYQLTPFLGFRTFIKIHKGKQPILLEPFAPGSHHRNQQMIISHNELELREVFPDHGLKVEVLYFILPEEKVAGLVRQVKITNLASRPINLELLDGLPVIIPYGLTNKDLKEQNRTIEAWMEVNNLEKSAPFFRLRSTPSDTSEIQTISAGNFAIAYAEQSESRRELSPIVDPENVFGQDTSLVFPEKFYQDALEDLYKQNQVTSGKTPCAFFGYAATLNPEESTSINSVYGHARAIKLLYEFSEHLAASRFLVQKREAAYKLIEGLTAPINTKTSSPVFDAYCRQTFLDNGLRGGWPVHLGNSGNPITYHIYSRKHGDPERDYNAFYIAAEYFSQGNGNYRDVNQNRRCEVFFDPQVEDTNIRSFMSLIQADGYNPLVLKGSRFWVPPDRRKALMSLARDPEKLLSLIEKPFTPGGLLKQLEEMEIDLRVSTIVFLEQALQDADRYFDAEYGEGYWTDHWTYNLDLIDSYLAVYPEKSVTLLFKQIDLPFFESPIFVQPRDRKYILVNNKPRQYGAVIFDRKKAALIASRGEYKNFMRTKEGLGEIYRTNLYIKLFILALIKFATMDPQGMGIEMEAGKPSWCDALNGLPGLFGSSMSETYELARLLMFLRNHLHESDTGSLQLPVEVNDLLQSVIHHLHIYLESDPETRDMHYWDEVSAAREAYRQKTRFGYEGETVVLPLEVLDDHLSVMYQKVHSGIERALRLNNGFPPTYFTYDVEEYEVQYSPESKPLVDEQNRPYIRAVRFRQRMLPIFLEGPVRFFRTLTDADTARKLHQRVRNSPLYDPVLKMYKTNASLENQPMEIGRLRAFTPGWLENESIFLHMEYKYLLELLRAGLYEEFFDDFRNALVAFQNPLRYGRSPLENSSFIVSSAHPDKKLHGRGFIARLTGATSEFISMWILMMAGNNPFFIDRGELCLRLQPALPGWLFDQQGKLSFTFLGRCEVNYHNPLRINTYDKQMQIQAMTLDLNNQQIKVQGNVLRQEYASLVREGRIKRIDAYFQREK